MSAMMTDDIFCSSLNYCSPLITVERPTNQRDINEKCGFADKKYVKSMPDIIDYPYRATKELTSKLGLPDTCDIGLKIQTMYPHINNYFQYCSIRGKLCFVTIYDVSIDDYNYNSKQSEFIIFQSPWKSADNQTIFSVGELNTNNRETRSKQPFRFVKHCFEYDLCVFFRDVIRQQNVCYSDMFDGEWMSQFIELMPQEIIPAEKHFDSQIDFDDSGLQEILNDVIIDDDDENNDHESREKGSNGHKIEYFGGVMEAFGISGAELKSEMTKSIRKSTKCAQISGDMVIDQIYFNKCYFHNECVLPVELENSKTGEIYKFGIVFIEQGGKYIFQQLLTPYMIYYNIGLNHPLNMGIVKPATIQWWPSQVGHKYYSFLNLFFTFDEQMQPQLRSNTYNNYCRVITGSPSGITIAESIEMVAFETTQAAKLLPSMIDITIPDVAVAVAVAVPVGVPVGMKPCDAVVPEINIIGDSNTVTVVTSASMVRGLSMKRNKIVKPTGQMVCPLPTIRESSEPPPTPIAPIVNPIDIGDTSTYTQVGRRMDVAANKHKFEHTQFNFRALSFSTRVDIVSKKLTTPRSMNSNLSLIETTNVVVDTKAESQKTTPRIASPSLRRNRGKAGKSKENRSKQGSVSSLSSVSPVSVITVTEMSSISDSDKDAAFTDWWSKMEGIKNSNKDPLASIVLTGKAIYQFCNFYSNISARIDEYGNIECEHCINGNGFSNKKRLENFGKLFNYCLTPYDVFWTEKVSECFTNTETNVDTFDGLKLWVDRVLPAYLAVESQKAAVAKEISDVDDIAAKKGVAVN